MRHEWVILLCKARDVTIRLKYISLSAVQRFSVFEISCLKNISYPQP